MNTNIGTVATLTAIWADNLEGQTVSYCIEPVLPNDINFDSNTGETTVVV